MLSTRVRLVISTFKGTRPCPALHHGTRNWKSNEEQLNALQITDPLAIYQAKVARGELEEDVEQIKALVKLRNVSRRLQDYTPPAHLLGILGAGKSSALNNVNRSLNHKYPTEKRQHDLIHYLTTQETLSDLDTPRGLLLTGPPGTGKSMVLDLWFDSLPSQGKFRRHYHHLMLTVYRIIWLEAEKRRMALRRGAPPQPMASSEKELEWGKYASSGPRRATIHPARGTGVVWKRGGEHGIRPDGKGSGWRRVLQGMPFFRADALSDSDDKGTFTENEQAFHESAVNLATVSSTSLPLHAAAQLFLNYGPVMLFDEVQLVDIASAGLLKRTLEAYWLLGGVVVGSSNRLPEDLYNNGVQQNQLIQFFEAFKNRCPVHEMKGERDFRRVPGALNFWLALDRQELDNQIHDQRLPDSSQSKSTSTSYFVRGQESAFDQRVSSLIGRRAPTPTTLKVYNRDVNIPVAYAPSESLPGVALFSFAQLCDSPLGSADYLTIASHFEEIVVRGVPQFLLVNKNQARRWITFIDAAYESGTRLHILAASGPDDLFFPEAKNERKEEWKESSKLSQAAAEPDDVVEMSARGARNHFLTPALGKSYPEEESIANTHAANRERSDGLDYGLTSEELIQSEVLSEARQDVEEGFRPHVSSYSDVRMSSPTSKSPIEQLAARRAEVEARRLAREQACFKETVVGFPDLAIFSGADERFSYARAVSRLYEMSRPVWRSRKAWTPLLERELRLWGVDTKNFIYRNSPESNKKTTTRSSKSSSGTMTTTTTTTTTTTSQSARDAGHSDIVLGGFADEASYETSAFPSTTSACLDDDIQSHQPQTISSWLEKGGSVAHNVPSTSRCRYTADTTFAEETHGERSATFSPRSFDGPPRISSVHVWGQADWGPGAGRWGQGPKAYASREAEQGERCASGTVGGEGGEKFRERRARLRQERMSKALRA